MGECVVREDRGESKSGEGEPLAPSNLWKVSEGRDDPGVTLRSEDHSGGMRAKGPLDEGKRPFGWGRERIVRKMETGL